MYRVLGPALLSALLAGCGMAASPLTAGFANSGQPTSALSARTQTASVDTAMASDPKPALKSADKAPKGSYEKAPQGALADRDYSRTDLDQERARQLINTYRKQHGLKPLVLNAALTEAAKLHSRDLAKWDRISHYGSDGSNPWDRVKRVGYRAKVAAENVGTGQASIDEVLKGWEASPGHNKNLLLREAEHMGIALVQDPRTEFKTFWTLLVGSSL
ncbi:MAG TPA: CAP domain-containing protein [Hyphomicrobiaceae bacterium]|jgi:uncharacterized protein YkwD|nr:CAP domain-containing protein [Hyphomicrobiaceae bacterium]